MALLRQCLGGLRGRTNYPSLEIILIDNGSTSADAISLLDEVERSGEVRVLRDTRPFSFSALNNLGASVAKGSVLCFLNNEIEPLEPDWLTEMVARVQRPGAGVVGAKLLYPDGRVQHAGVVLCGDHVARHAHHGIAGDAPGYKGRARQVQTLSAVTGACMVVRRETFQATGGFDAEAFAVDFNDTDLCLRAAVAGYPTVWTPPARLLHHESASRGTFVTPVKAARYEVERAAMVKRWGALQYDDPYYNPNLTLDAEAESFDLAWPPRSIDR